MTVYYGYSPLLKLIDHFGGTATKLAKVLGVTPGAIAQWLEQGYLPANRAIQVERMTNGLFKAVDLAK